MIHTKNTYLLAFLLCFGSLAVADTPQLSVNPDSLFFRQNGASQAPAAMTVGLTAKGATLGAFTATAATTSGGSWLSVTPTSGSGAGSLNVSVKVGSLGAGEYSGTITVAAAGFATPAVVKVTLEVNGNGDENSDHGGAATMLVHPSSLKFSAVAGGPAPKAQELDITTPAGANAAWTAVVSVSTPSGGKWLKASPTSGTGKGSVDVSVDPTGLAQGQYTGQVLVTSGSSSSTVAVSLTVGAAQPAKLVIDPAAFNFIVEPNSTQAPAPRTLNIKNAGGGTFTWTASAAISSPTGGKWLTITPTSGSGPGTITLKADPTGLGVGMYAGTVTVKAGTDSSTAQVFLRILGPAKPVVVVAPKSLTFTATPGGVVAPATRTVNINSNTTGLTYTATATTAKGGNWLTISGASGGVPGAITASATAGTLAPGIYTGSIQVKIAGAAQEVHNVAVVLKVFASNEPAHLEVEPGALAFTGVKGGTSPAAKTVKLIPENIASVAWSATATTASGGSWLSVSPASGTTTATANSVLNVSVSLGSLATGTYKGSVLVTPAIASNVPPVTIGVTLIVTSGSTMQPDLVARSVSGGAAIAAGPLVALFTSPGDHFTSAADLPLNVAVTLLDSAGSPVTGATITVSSSNSEPDMILTDLGGGQYAGVFQALGSGTLTLSGAAQLDTQGATAFTVSGDVESAVSQPTIIFQNGAVSAASYAVSPTPVAPGSLLSVFGLGMAGSGGAAGSGSLPTTLGGVTVTIGGFTSPLVSVVPGVGDQINLQVPFELNGLAQADIVVNNNGVLGVPNTVAIGVAPAFFTLSQSGTGAGAFLHGATFAPVSSTSPAQAGEVLLLYATGLGVVSPSIQTGALATTANVVGNVTVTIGGFQATVQYAGTAPGFAGLYQLNVVVPSGVSGDAQVVVLVDGVPATGRATVTMQ